MPVLALESNMKKTQTHETPPTMLESRHKTLGLWCLPLASQRHPAVYVPLPKHVIGVTFSLLTVLPRAHLNL